jgi:hypothetical protein
VDVGHRSVELGARDSHRNRAADLPHTQECHSERERIGDGMAKAYPDEHDFEIACRLSPPRAES